VSCLMPATGSGEGGTTFLLDLPQATALRDGDVRCAPLPSDTQS
jgi:hypothetical protein